MNDVIYESARVSFLEGALIVIGILWMLGFLRTKVYVPIIVKEEKKSSSEEKEVVAKNNERTIYRTKQNKDESYTDFEELKS